MLMRMVDVSEYAALGVKVEDGRLFIGSHEVAQPRFVQGDKIGALYLIRVFRDGWWQLVTGLDLSKGMFWLGGLDIGGHKATLPPCWFDSIQAIERMLNQFSEEAKGEKWAIFEEQCNTPEEEEEERQREAAAWDELMDFD